MLTLPCPHPRANGTLLTHPQILQYKKKCSELEQQLLERSTELEQQRLKVGARAGRGRPFPLRAQLMPTPPTQDTEHSRDLESTLIRLEEEQQRWGAAGKGHGGGSMVLPSPEPTGPSLSHPGAAAWPR